MSGVGASARMFTIYRAREPVPVGRRYAVVEWVLTGGGEVSAGVVRFAGSLNGARDQVPVGAGFRLGRDAADQPEIVETWI